LFTSSSIARLTKTQWKILASAANFLAFLGGYTIFLGPMTSILIVEFVSPQLPTPSPHALMPHSYFIVRRGNVSVPDMYNFHGMYRYSPRYASNWRAVVAFIIGCVPPLPGFVNSIVIAGNGTTSVSLGGQHL
jgi:NCS1 family nucleobase:cation symporter-1